MSTYYSTPIVGTNWAVYVEDFFSDLEYYDYFRFLESATALQSIEAGQAVCLRTNGLLLARADGYHQPCVGMAIEDTDEGASCRYKIEGFITNDSWNWTPGAILYLSDTVYGALTETPPVNNKQVVGFAWNATTVFLQGTTLIQSHVTATTSTTTTSSSTVTTTTTSNTGTTSSSSSTTSSSTTSSSTTSSSTTTSSTSTTTTTAP